MVAQGLLQLLQVRLGYQVLGYHDGDGCGAAVIADFQDLQFLGAHVHAAVVAALHAATNRADEVVRQGGAHRLVGAGEEHDRDGCARGVFQLHGGVLVTAGLGDTARNAGEHTRNSDGFAVAHVRVFADDVVHRMGCGIRERTFQTTQRVIRNVQAQHVTLKVQLLAAVPVGYVRDGHGQFVAEGVVHAEGAEEVELARRLLTLDRHGGIHCRLVDEGQGTARMTQVVESARLNERLDGALIAHLQRHLLQEVVEGLVTALLLAGGNHALNHVRAHVTNRTHTEANIIADRGKRQGGLVHVRGEHGNAHGAALVQVQCELVLVIAHTGQQSSHVLLREVRLQVRSPVRYQTVRSRVRLVERVVRERQQNIPERLNSALRVAVRNHAVVEGSVLLIQLRLLLLTHRTAQQVCLTQSVVRDLLGNRHNLLLIHDQAVGGVQNVLQRLF